MLGYRAEGSRTYYRGQDLKTWKPWSHREQPQQKEVPGTPCKALPHQAAGSFSPPTARVQWTLPSQYSFKGRLFSIIQPFLKESLHRLELQPPKGFSSSIYFICCLAFLNWHYLNLHEVTRNRGHIIFLVQALCFCQKHYGSIFENPTPHLLTMSFPHQLASSQPREIRVFLVGFFLDLSCKILKPKGYQHLWLLPNRESVHNQASRNKKW